MRVRALALLFVVAAVLGAGAQAGADPDPNGPAKHGLCTAYHNGSQTGRDHKHDAGPFKALEEAADEDGDGDPTETADEVRAFCEGMIGGNPDVRG